MLLISPQGANSHWNFELFQHNLGLVSSARFKIATLSVKRLMAIVTQHDRVFGTFVERREL